MLLAACCDVALSLAPAPFCLHCGVLAPPVAPPPAPQVVPPAVCMKQSCTPLAIDKLPLSSTHVRRYYVRKCNKPKQRAALGLAVKVGSVVEADTEQGVAHIVEHLAFNATEVGMCAVVPAVQQQTEL